MQRNQSGTPRDWGLSSLHKEYLKDRAISLDVAKKCKLTTITGPEAEVILGYPLRSEALAVPYSHIPGSLNDHWRVRPDKPGPDGARWLTEKGVCRPYLPPVIPKKSWADITQAIVILESPPKSLSVLSQELLSDFLPIGLGGAQAGGHDKEAKERGEYRLHPELWDRVKWKGRKVYILLDSNRRNKPGVLAGEKLLARCLEAAGAIVYIVELPPQDEDKDWGPDDFLAAKGPSALRALIEAAQLAADMHNPFKEIKRNLSRTKQGTVLGGPDNAEIVLSSDPRWQGVIWFDEFAGRVIFRAYPPWDEGYAPASSQGFWADEDDMRLSIWLSRHWGVKIGEKQASNLVQVIARKNLCHPVKEFLSGLTWDKTPRLDRAFQEYFGASDTPYTRAVSAKMLISAVARIFQPGCQAKYSVILEGPQDLGKSEAIRALVGDDWFTDSLPDLRDKEAAIQIAGKWVVELAELSSLGRTEVEQIKAFLSRRTDRYRAVFGRRSEDHPRQCVFIGTTNPSTYLKDATGGVRFWPVRCATADREGLARDREQLWAEAFARYQAGEKWWLDEVEVIALARAEQDIRYQEDAWEDLIAEYIDGKTRVAVRQILKDVFFIEEKDWSKPVQDRVIRCLERLGWDKYPNNKGKTKIEGRPVTTYVPKVTPSTQGGYQEGLPGKTHDSNINNTSVTPSNPSNPLLEKVKETRGDRLEKRSDREGLPGLPATSDSDDEVWI